MGCRILGVDFGDTRTGLAVTDELGILAVGIGCIKETYIVHTAEEVSKKASEYGVVKIVVGYPMNMNGTVGPRAQRAAEFAELLRERCDCPVVLFDERMTTMSAARYLNMTDVRGKKRKEVIDTLSAQIILQNYIDSHRSTPS